MYETRYSTPEKVHFRNMLSSYIGIKYWCGYSWYCTSCHHRESLYFREFSKTKQQEHVNKLFYLCTGFFSLLGAVIFFNKVTGYQTKNLCFPQLHLFLLSWLIRSFKWWKLSPLLLKTCWKGLAQKVFSELFSYSGK